MKLSVTVYRRVSLGNIETIGSGARSDAERVRMGAVVRGTGATTAAAGSSYLFLTSEQCWLGRCLRSGSKPSSRRYCEVLR